MVTRYQLLQFPMGHADAARHFQWSPILPCASPCKTTYMVKPGIADTDTNFLCNFVLSRDQGTICILYLFLIVLIIYTKVYRYDGDFCGFTFILIYIGFDIIILIMK